MNGLTTYDIATLVNRSIRAVQQRKNIDDYLVGYAPSSGNGRRAKLFKPTVLQLWGVNPAEYADVDNPDAAISDKRSDAGKSRVFGELEPFLIKKAKEYYLSMPTKNLSEACRMTANYAKLEGHDIDWEQLHRRLARRKTATCDFSSPYYSENWIKIHDAVYRVRKNRFYNNPFTLYNRFAMFRNAGLLGKGFGSRRVIVVDDFKRDVWVNNDGKMDMPWGLVFIDGITNKPLTIVPCDTITTDIIAAGVLMTAFAHGIHHDTVWVFETSKAMKNKNIIGLIESLYSPEQLAAFQHSEHWVRKLFDGQTGPYVNSPSQIAQSIFKSRVERSLRNFKDEFDGVYFPTAYQGGGRTEGVELDLSGSPLQYLSEEKPGVELDRPFSHRLIPIRGYWERFYNWTFGKYIHISRVSKSGSMFKHFCDVFDFDGSPSIQEVHDYFTSDNDGSFKPDMSNMDRFAMLLFYAQPSRHSYTVKINRIGSYITTINGRQLNLVSHELNESHVGLRVATIPIPGVDNVNQFVVVDVTNKDKPEFLAIARDFTATTLDEAKQMRNEIRTLRESNIKRLRQDGKDHYVEIGDDFNYTPDYPDVEEWTEELAGQSSKLMNKQTDDDDEEIEEVKEYTFKSDKAKKLLDNLNLDL